MRRISAWPFLFGEIAPFKHKAIIINYSYNYIQILKHLREDNIMFLRTTQAAEFLGVRKSTLEAWRVRGGGPVFLKLGKAVRYRREDLDQFINCKLRTSTSDMGQDAA